MTPTRASKPMEWREHDERWQARGFYLSSFVRMNAEITTHVYEFIDHLINEKYRPPLGSLHDVDAEIKRLYTEYAEETNWDDRI